MKVLVVYYSRTNVTKKVAEYICSKMSCSCEQLVDVKDRSGKVGYIVAGKDAVFGRTTEIKSLTYDPSDFDLVLIGTPVWGFYMAPAVRTYIEKFRGSFPDVAFFCTMGGSGDKRTFFDMEKSIGKKPLHKLACKTEEVMKNQCGKKLDDFIERLNI